MTAVFRLSDKVAIFKSKLELWMDNYGITYELVNFRIFEMFQMLAENFETFRAFFLQADT